MGAEMSSPNNTGHIPYSSLINFYGSNGINNSVNSLQNFPSVNEQHTSSQNIEVKPEIITIAEEQDDIHIVENSSDVGTNHKDLVQISDSSKNILNSCDMNSEFSVSNTDCVILNCDEGTDVKCENPASRKRKIEMGSGSLRKKRKRKSGKNMTSPESQVSDEGTSDMMVNLTLSPSDCHEISARCSESDIKSKNDSGFHSDSVIILDSDDEIINLDDSDVIVMNPDHKKSSTAHDVSVEILSHNVGKQNSSDLNFIPLFGFEDESRSQQDSLFFEDRNGVQVVHDSRGRLRDISKRGLPKKTFGKFKKRYCEQSDSKDVEIISTSKECRHRSKFRKSKHLSECVGTTSKEKIVENKESVNVFNPGLSKKQTGLRPVIIDGSNVALGHSNGKDFSWRGLAMCIDHFANQGHKVIAFVPKYRRSQVHSADSHIIEKYEKSGQVVFTPSRWLNGQLKMSYDDRYIVQCAFELGGVIVSTDNFRDVMHLNPGWRETVEKRLLMFTWVGDMLMFPTDPLGRHGPTLTKFLRFPD